MEYIKQVFIVSGITMVGEVLDAVLPLPISPGVCGLLLMLLGLYTEVVKVSDVEDMRNFLLDTAPMMFIPVSVDLVESYGAMKAVLMPLFTISVISTIIVTMVTGKVTELIIHLTREGREAQRKSS